MSKSYPEKKNKQSDYSGSRKTWQENLYEYNKTRKSWDFNGARKNGITKILKEILDNLKE